MAYPSMETRKNLLRIVQTECFQDFLCGLGIDLSRRKRGDLVAHQIIACPPLPRHTSCRNVSLLSLASCLSSAINRPRLFDIRVCSPELSNTVSYPHPLQSNALIDGFRRHTRPVPPRPILSAASVSDKFVPTSRVAGPSRGVTQPQVSREHSTSFVAKIL